MRASAADVLGGLRDTSLVELLVRLTSDDDLDVQAHALRAAGQLQHSELLPVIANRLGDPRAAALATQALLAYGAGMVTTLDAVFADARTAIAVRRLIRKVLGRCPSQDSVLILLKHMEEPDDLTRARIYKALVRLQANQVPIPREKRVEVMAQLMAELRIAYELAVLRADLGSTEVLLDDALAWRQQYSADRIFYLLGLLHPETNMAQIRAALTDSDTRRRANAIELLGTFVARPIKALLLPLLEGPEARIRQVAVEQADLRPRPTHAWVAQLAQGADPWLAACAVHSIGQHGWVEHAPLVRAALDVDDPLLRETSVRALSRLLPREAFRDGARAHGAEEARPWPHGDAYRQRVDPVDSEQGVASMPLTTIERILLLRGVDLFQKLPGEDIALIAQVCDDVAFPAGERFITQGEVGTCIFWSMAKPPLRSRVLAQWHTAAAEM
jgi:HEAT repeat protein